MESSYEIAHLGAVAKVRSGFAFKSRDFTDSGYPVIRIKEVVPPSVDIGSATKIPEYVISSTKRIVNYELFEGDILIAMTGATVGKIGRLPHSEQRVFLNQRVGKVYLQDSEADYDYVYYALSYEPNTAQMLSIADGSAQANISGKQIESIEIPLPPLPEQKAIAHILGSLDDKIELNRKMNETLEAMARAIFKSWFVDFDPVLRNAIRSGNAIPPEYQERAERLKTQPNMSAVASAKAEGMNAETAKLFPDSFEDSELGMIPKGWRVGSGIDVADVGIGKTPPRKEKHWFSLDSTDMKWLSIRDMGAAGVYALDTSEYLTHEAIDRFNVRIAPANTVLLSFKLTVGRTVIAADQMATNEAIAHFSLRDDAPLSSEYLFCYLKEFDYHSLGSTSSIATAVNSKTIKAMPILIPVLPAVDAFTESIAPVFSSIQAHLRQNEGLTQTRNALLPKLLSGQIRIKDAEKFMEDAA